MSSPIPSGRSRCSNMRRRNFGDPDAEYNLARMYMDGAAGLTKNNMRAARWLALAAEKHHHPAQALLGHLLFAGRRRAPPAREGPDVARHRQERRPGRRRTPGWSISTPRISPSPATKTARSPRSISATTQGARRRRRTRSRAGACSRGGPAAACRRPRRRRSRLFEQRADGGLRRAARSAAAAITVGAVQTAVP